MNFIKIIFILSLLFTACSRFESGEKIFIENKKCLSALSQCIFKHNNKTIFELHFDQLPQNKSRTYQLSLGTDAKKVELVSAELIGMNMEMPDNRVKFQEVKPGFYKARIIPGLCSESKMLWRLKVSLVLSNRNQYYTFIDYQVGR